VKGAPFDTPPLRSPRVVAAGRVSSGGYSVELRRARGKQLYDKRASIKESGTRRQVDRAMKSRGAPARFRLATSICVVTASARPGTKGAAKPLAQLSTLPMYSPNEPSFTGEKMYMRLACSPQREVLRQGLRAYGRKLLSSRMLKETAHSEVGLAGTKKELCPAA
jgi:hypothetical protein